MSDPVQLDKAIRIVLPHLSGTAAAAVLQAALEGRRFGEHFVEATCGVCGEIRPLPIWMLSGELGTCARCEKPADERERRG